MASRERALRRQRRLAEAARRRAAAERRERRRRLLRRLRPRLPRRRTGRVFPRRSRPQRAGITVVALTAVMLIWYLAPTYPLRIGLTGLLLLGLPAFVILALDRRT